MKMNIKTAKFFYRLDFALAVTFLTHWLHSGGWWLLVIAILTGLKALVFDFLIEEAYQDVMRFTADMVGEKEVPDLEIVLFERSKK